MTAQRRRRIDRPATRHALAVRLLTVTSSNRDTWLRPTAAAAERAGVSRTTIWRWNKAVEKQGHPGRPRVPPEAQLEASIRGLYYKSAGNASRTHRILMAQNGDGEGDEIGTEGKVDFSLRTMQRYAAAIPKPERVFALEGNAAMGHKTYVRLPMVVGHQRNDVWQLDGRELDDFVVNSHGGTFRPFVISVLDDATRALVGWVLTDARHNSTDVAMAFASALLPDPEGKNPFHGIPRAVLIDNGAEYISDHFQRILGRLGINVIALPPHVPELHGKVERWHRTMDLLKLAGLPGYMGGPRHDNDKLRVDGRSLLNFDQFAAIMRELDIEYNSRIHSELQMSPIDRWNQDTGVIRTLTNDPQGEAEALAPLLLREETRTVQREGIKVKIDRISQNFIATELATRQGEEVRVGYLPHDDTQLWVYDLDGTFLCVAKPRDILTKQERDIFLAVRSAEGKQARRAVKQAREAAYVGFPTHTIPAGRWTRPGNGAEHAEDGEQVVALDPTSSTTPEPATELTIPTAEDSAAGESTRTSHERGERYRDTPQSADEIERLAFGLDEGEPA